ncbi:MAG: putative lipid II flippase FtsW [Acidobacteriota bacterium]
MAKKLAFDRVLFTTVAILIGFGLVMVYSASAALARPEGLNQFLVRQAVAVVVGGLAMLAVMHLDYRWLRRPAVIYTLLAGAGFLLVVVLFAPTLNNVRRWLFIGGVSLQPSELAKLALIPFLAYQIEKKQDRINTGALLVPCAAVAGVMALLVMREPDMGTAVLLASTMVLMLFIAGLSWRWIAAGGLLTVPLAWLLVFSAPYRRERFFAFMAPEKDPLGAGFQALQSLIAVGSGGFAGLGPGQSMQKLYFLPYPHTDFVFAIVAEELGMLGAIAVVGLFAVLLWRGVRAGLNAPDVFGRYLAFGFTGILVLQALLNISVAIALCPTKGIPLPFVSYGGCSLVVSMAASGVLLNVSQHG